MAQDQQRQTDDQLQTLRDAGVPVQLSSSLQAEQLLEIGESTGCSSLGIHVVCTNFLTIDALKKQLATALVYPLIVCVLALAFVFFQGGAQLAMDQMLQDISPADAVAEVTLMNSLTHGLPSLFLVSILVSLAVLFWWSISLRLQSRNLAFVPGLAAVKRDVGLSGTAQLAHELVRNGTQPQVAIQKASHAILGKPLASLPPFLQWAVDDLNSSEVDLAKHDSASLSIAADLYRERALERAGWLRWAIPLCFLGLAGGGTVLLYALTFWGPFCQILGRLSEITVQL